MKFMLTHCYTDHNKGDAAIIVSTIQLIKKLDENAEINLLSTFGPKDYRFKTEHEFVKEFSNKIYPGLFHVPEPLIRGSEWSRLLSYILIMLKSLVLLITKQPIILSAFYTKNEIEGINKFIDSDIILSKGGSYLTAQNTSLRQSLSLISLLYPFFLSRRYKKKIVIFSQSLGPIKGKFNQWITKVALSKIDACYLREKVCVETYKEISNIGEVIGFKYIPDSAFSLSLDKKYSEFDLPINSSFFNVGFTLVDHAFKYISSDKDRLCKIEIYKNAVVKSMIHLIEDKNAYIHIFPQVISDNSHLGHSDVKISKEVEQTLSQLGYADRVKYYYYDFNSMQLKNMYSNMDIFIGTRLHSVIFSLSCNVPSINIAYHGTKSQGILSGIEGFEELVLSIDTLTEDILIAKTNYLFDKMELLRKNLEIQNIAQQKRLVEAMSEVIELVNNK